MQNAHLAKSAAFQTEVEAHVDADHHNQFQAAGHQPLGKGEVEVVKGKIMLAQAITHMDLLQVIEDGLRPIRVSLVSIEGRTRRFEDGPGLPVHHTNSALHLRAQLHTLLYHSPLMLLLWRHFHL
jgi:hypothetical protein